MEKYKSIEDYLEKIYVLSQTSKVKSINIANDMGFSRASVSVAMKKLRELGYVKFDNKNYIELTKSGKLIAIKVYERHTIISKALMLLGVEEQIALSDACKIEHILSEESFAALKKYMEKIKA